ncbi:MAG: hypothetical protein KY469_22910 [Actinobacteria bacterium]|nr:hypothetical protein [Actinomycetota bacterium]
MSDRMAVIGPGRMGLALGGALHHAGALESLSFFGRSPEPPPHPLFDADAVHYAMGTTRPPDGTTVLVLGVQDDALHEVAGALASEDSYLNQGVRDLGRAVETRLGALHEVITALEDDESHLNKSVGDLAGQLTDVHETVVGLRGDVERITDRLPDPSRGPLEKARDVLTSGDAGSTG